MEETEAFVRVVRAGGFAEAGRRLGVPRSTLSKQVQRLETRLGVQLLRRTTRQVALTEAGEAYFARCEPAVDALVAAEQEARSYRDGPRGTLVVSVPYDALRHWIGPLVTDFHAAYPDVQLRLRVTSKRVHLVREGVDIAIRGGTQEDSSLVARCLVPSALGLYAAPAYLDAHGRPETPEDLAGHTLVSFAGPPSGWPLPHPDGGTFLLPVDGWLVINEWHTVTQCVVAGGGVALLVGLDAAPHVAAGRLERLLPDVSVGNAGLYAVFPAAQRRTPKVRAFVDFYAERLGPPHREPPP